jgi:hypothetical protein
MVLRRGNPDRRGAGEKPESASLRAGEEFVHRDVIFKIFAETHYSWIAVTENVIFP